VIDAHGPCDEGGVGTTIEQSGLDDLSLSEPGHSRDVFGSEGGGELGGLRIAVGVPVDIATID
jgi:hypothetical protein